MLTKQGQSGIALIMTLLIVAVVAVLVSGSLILALTNQRVSHNDATSRQALLVAQAGNAFWKAELVSLYQYMTHNFELYEDEITAHIAAGNNIACGNYLSIGLDLSRDGDIDYALGSTLPAIKIPVGDGTGSSAVTFDVQGSTVVLDARGTVFGARSRVIEEFSIANINLWNNAVFAQTSAANATIKGRAEIRGAIHILGTGLDSDDVALDITGSFGLGNNYRGLNSSLDVGAGDMRLTFPDPQDLCATLRVKHGKVLMSGSSQIGYNEDDNPEPFVDNMRGIYTNDSIDGGDDSGEEQNVFSENGMHAAYDAGDSYVFPELDDVRSDGRTWAEALEDNALVLSLTGNDDRQFLPDEASGTVSSEGFYLSTGCKSATLFGVAPGGNPGGVFTLEYDATADFSCTKYHSTDASPDPATDEIIVSVSWDKYNNILTLGGTGGVVMFEGGNLLITGGNNQEITYKGRGILFVEETGSVGGDITLEVDFLPADGDAVLIDDNGRLDTTGTPDNSYPATTLLGLVARNNVNSSGAQKRVTAAIYAEESVSVTKQTLIAGAIVTKEFDAGSQVPTVLYVPSLAERLPEFMPGAGGSGFAVSNVAWTRQAPLE